MNTKELTPLESEKELNNTMTSLLCDQIIHRILLLEGSFLTGSQCWYKNSTVTSDVSESDIDICVSEKSRLEVIDIINKFHFKITPGTYNNGIFFNINENTINVIFLSNNDLKPWRLATEIMNILTREFACLGLNKTLRHEVFESLRVWLRYEFL